MPSETDLAGTAGDPPPDDRDPQAEVAAHFEVAVFSVCAALAGALITALVVARAGALQTGAALPWLAFMIAMGVVHIALAMRFRRLPPQSRATRFWATAPLAITLIESLGWGFAALALARRDSAEAQMLVMLTTIGVSAGSVIGYGRSLPTRMIAFLMPTAPFLIYCLLSGNPVLHGASYLLILYMAAIGHLGLAADRGFRREVSMRKRNAALVEALAREKQNAERATLAKSTFLAAASHDLRQPIHALGLFLGALRGSRLPEDAAALVDKMGVSIVSMDRLFSGILDISRLDAGVIAAQRGAVDLRAALLRLAVEFEEEASRKGLRFSVEAVEGFVDSDSVLLERIIRNIVANAIRYTDEGGVRIRCKRRREKLELQIWDSGCGIARRHLDSIFDEYFQISNPERDREKGLGLGLAIVRRLSQLIGADLQVRSREGRGSCFCVRLPLAARPAPAEAMQDPLARVESGGLIVVVDDEAPIREAMREVLSRWGYSVLTAASGAQALTRLETLGRSPRLAVCDYRLRGAETGADVVLAFRARFGAAFPIILITGDTAPARLCEAKATGCLLLHKPLAHGKLRAAIANLLVDAGGAPMGRHEAPASKVAALRGRLEDAREPL